MLQKKVLTKLSLDIKIVLKGGLMKKILLALMVLSIATAVYAAETNTTTTTTPSSFLSKYTQKMREVGQKLDQTSNDIDAKILEQQQKAQEQQKKYEEEKAARDAKILEQQKARQEAYDAAQKRLEEKREQLRLLLEE